MWRQTDSPTAITTNAATRFLLFSGVCSLETYATNPGKPFSDKSCLAAIWQHHIVNPDIYYYFNGSGCKYINVRDLNELTHARVGPILKSIIFGGFGMLRHIKHLWLSEERPGHQTSSNIWGHQEEHLKSHEKTQLKLTDPSEISSCFSGPPTFLMDFIYVYISVLPQTKTSWKTGKNPPQTQTPPARGGVWNLGLGF